MDGLGWTILVFVFGLIVGCGLGHRWIKVTYHEGFG